MLLMVVVAQGANTLTQHGITWTFQQDINDTNEAGQYQYGQFANGDYWIVNNSGVNEPNVVITDIDPCSWDDDGHIRNGSMINPLQTEEGTGWVQGFDNTVYNSNTYSSSLNVAYGVNEANVLSVDPCSSLVSSISVDGENQWSQLETAAVLTILPKSNIPAANSFRPPLAGDSFKTTFWSEDDLDYSILEDITSSHASKPALASVEALVERPWLDWSRAWSINTRAAPEDNMPNYGKDYGVWVGKVALALNTDWGASSKRDLYVGFVQVGIDLFGAQQQGMHWQEDCGIWGGRKLPILFAGLALNDANMTGIMSKTGDYLYTGDYGEGNQPPDYIPFSEDGQTFYVKQSDVDRVHYTGFETPDPNKDYDANHLGMPEYGTKHSWRPMHDDVQWDAAYRECCTAASWAGIQLTLLIMDNQCNTKSLWNHNAFFDYMDRYMDVTLSLYGEGHYKRQVDDWTEDMWDAYRDDYGCVWTRADPNDPCSNGSQPCDNGLTAPTGLIVAKQIPTNSRLALVWTAGSGASYQRLLKIFDGQTVVEVNNIDISATSQVVTGLDSGETYGWKITIVDVNGNNVGQTIIKEVTMDNKRAIF